MTGKVAGTDITGRLYVKAALYDADLPCAYRVIGRRVWVSNHVFHLPMDVCSNSTPTITEPHRFCGSSRLDNIDMRSWSTSKLVLFILRICLSYVHSAIATTPIVSPLQNFSSLVLNDLSPAIGIDPRLQIYTKYHDAYLPLRPCLMNTVEALAFLAGKDYHGTIPQATISAPGYTDVQIQFKPRQGAPTLPVRPAVLGLYLAIIAMTSDPTMQQRLRMATWGIVWEGVIVTYIWLKQSDVSNQIQTQNSTGLPSGTLLKLNDTTPLVLAEDANNGQSTTRTDPTNTDVELIMSFYPWGTPLIEMSVFVTVLGALKDAAQYPGTSIVPEDFEISVPISDVSIAFIRTSSHGLTGPPSFEYQWAIKAAKQIPGWMVDHRFWESEFIIEINGFVPGEGWVRRKGYAGVEGNVTTSSCVQACSLVHHTDTVAAGGETSKVLLGI